MSEENNKARFEMCVCGRHGKLCNVEGDTLTDERTKYDLIIRLFDEVDVEIPRDKVSEILKQIFASPLLFSPSELDEDEMMETMQEKIQSFRDNGLLTSY